MSDRPHGATRPTVGRQERPTPRSNRTSRPTQSISGTRERPERTPLPPRTCHPGPSRSRGEVGVPVSQPVEQELTQVSTGSPCPVDEWHVYDGGQRHTRLTLTRSEPRTRRRNRFTCLVYTGKRERRLEVYHLSSTRQTLQSPDVSGLRI